VIIIQADTRETIADDIIDRNIRNVVKALEKNVRDESVVF
jgi:hypothetical protein